MKHTFKTHIEMHIILYILGFLSTAFNIAMNKAQAAILIQVLEYFRVSEKKLEIKAKMVHCFMRKAKYVCTYIF